MLVDRLIGRLLRRTMRFGGAESSISLPPPSPVRPYLLYLHIPFCFSLCPFCTFHRVLFDDRSAVGYFDSLRREIDIVSDAGFRFDEVYIGGGTPTVLPDELVATIRHVRERHPVATISVETNPNFLEAGRLDALRAAGVNRLSVGVQSFDDDLLAEMGRLDSYGSGDDIRRRLRDCRDAFDTLNIDMIFNLPHQSEALLARDLDILTDDVEADQVSYYPLMAASSVRDAMRQSMGEVDHDYEKLYYRLISTRLLGAGYTRNSAWCFSRHPGEFDEYIVRRDEYLGLGSGAFSYLDGQLFAATFSIPEYQARVADGRTGTSRRQKLNLRDQMRYHLLVTLFSGAMDKRAADRQFDGSFMKAMWPELAALKALRAVRDTGDRLELTESGYYLWVVLMREFFTSINALRDEMRRPPAPVTPV